MFRKQRTFVIFIVVICILFCCSCSKKNGEKEVITGLVDYPSYDSIHSMTKEAEYIIHGKVIGKEYEWRATSYPAVELYLNPEDIPPVEEDLLTVYTVQVTDHYLRKSEAAEIIEVLVRGGETDTTIYRYEGTPELFVNNEYVFFLSKSSLFENAGWPLNLNQSIYKVEGTDISKVTGGFELTFEVLENLDK